MVKIFAMFVVSVLSVFMLSSKVMADNNGQIVSVNVVYNNFYPGWFYGVLNGHDVDVLFSLTTDTTKIPAGTNLIFIVEDWHGPAAHNTDFATGANGSVFGVVGLDRIIGDVFCLHVYTDWNGDGIVDESGFNGPRDYEIDNIVYFLN